jgi:hypothetical protein
MGFWNWRRISVPPLKSIPKANPLKIALRTPIRNRIEERV